MSNAKEIITVGLVGNSIPGLIAQCIEAAGINNRWHIVDIDRELVQVSRSKPLSLVRKSFELLRGILNVRKVDIVIVVFVSPFASIYKTAAHFFGKKIVYYWLGSDVAAALASRNAEKRFKGADLNLSYGEGNIAELASIGIDAHLLVTPTRLSEGIAKMPERHAVLLSIPDSRKEFYGYNDLMRLVDLFPQVNFYVVRSGHPEYYDRPNIIFKGMLDREQMSELFNEVSISVRWPEHDGTSLILIESALKGKYIISRNPFPCGVVTSSFEDLCRVLTDLINEPPRPCEENREYALSHFTQDRAGLILAGYLENLIMR